MTLNALQSYYFMTKVLCTYIVCTSINLSHTILGFARHVIKWCFKATILHCKAILDRGTTYANDKFWYQLSFCLSVYLFICLSVSLSIYLSIYLSMYLFYSILSIDLSMFSCLECRKTKQQGYSLQTNLSSLKNEQTNKHTIKQNYARKF